MVPSKAILVCLVFALCFVVISSEATARELADKTQEKTNSVEHTAPTKEVKTEANGVKPDYYYRPPYPRPYPYPRPHPYPYPYPYPRPHPPYPYPRPHPPYPPERKTQEESTFTENPDFYPYPHYPYPHYPYYPPYRGYPPGGEN